MSTSIFAFTISILICIGVNNLMLLGEHNNGSSRQNNKTQIISRRQTCVKTRNEKLLFHKTSSDYYLTIFNAPIVNLFSCWR